MHLYLEPGILDTPEPDDTLYLAPGVTYAFLLGARCLRHPRTWCQVSHVHFYLVPGVLDTLKPGASCPKWPFTWCQESEIPQNLVQGVP